MPACRAATRGIAGSLHVPALPCKAPACKGEDGLRLGSGPALLRLAEPAFSIYKYVAQRGRGGGGPTCTLQGPGWRRRSGRVRALAGVVVAITAPDIVAAGLAQLGGPAERPAEARPPRSCGRQRHRSHRRLPPAFAAAESRFSEPAHAPVRPMGRGEAPAVCPAPPMRDG